MALMSKNKPTKKVEFPGGFVELQHLSKGVKDQIQSSLASLYKELESINTDKLEKQGNSDLPEDFDMEPILKSLDKINQVEYYKLSKAIKSWSEQDPITEDTVKELDEDVFKEISQQINEMNSLSADERKN